MRFIFLFCLCSVLSVNGAEDATALKDADSSVLSVQEDSLKIAVDSGAAAIVADSVDSLHETATRTDTLDRSVLVQKKAPPPQLQTPPRASTRKITLTKRNFNYKQQIKLAVGMMAFVAILIFTSQNLNPN